MKYKIILDSSCNIEEDTYKEKDIDIKITPLSIMIGDDVFIDDKNIDTLNMLSKLNNSKIKATTSCPSIYDYMKLLDDKTPTFIITISSKLSGSYNVANIAKDEIENNKNIHVIDSRLTAGGLELILIKLIELIKNNNLSFNEIVSSIEDYRDSLNLLFILNKYDNLEKNGRISKIAALIAKTLVIKPLCAAKQGEIIVKEKVRTAKGVIKRLIYNIGLMLKDTKDKICIISHTQDKETADYLKEEIEKEYQFKEIIIRENKGLNAFYSLEQGIIVSFG